jgi:hypothetical protein
MWRVKSGLGVCGWVLCRGRGGGGVLGLGGFHEGGEESVEVYESVAGEVIGAGAEGGDDCGHIGE